MRPQILYLLTIATLLVLVGLISVQIYWVDNAISLKESEFEQKVNDALVVVTQKLERLEAMEKVRSHQRGRFLFFDSDTVDQLDEATFRENAIYSVTKEISRKENSLQIKTIEEEENKTTINIIETSPSITDTFSNQSLLETDMKMDVLPDSTNFHKVHEDHISLDSALQHKIGNKTAFVGDIVKSLIEIDLSQSMQDRVNPTILDSLLKRELASKAITTSFEYGILNSRNELLISSKPELDQEIQLSNIKTNLFPNDIIDNPHTLKLFFPNRVGFLLKNMWVMLVVSILLIIAIISSFLFALRTIFHQKKLSEIKNDFINNMTHELKTPIATISLAHEALLDPDMSANQKITSRYIGIIGEENKRLGTLVQNVLQHAVLDKGEFNLKLEQINFHDIIEDVVSKIDLQVKGKGGNITVNLDAEKSTFDADIIHLTNVVYNLMDNAVKYSKNEPEIYVKTRNSENNIHLIVKDNGLGIKKEDQKRIFDQLYRVPTGNVHDVKGFGLGLNYVKIIVEKHGGSVKVESQLNKGSTFEIILPLKTTI